MGKPQGDGLPDPVYYEREVDGETVRRPAYTPADHVNLKAHGWVEASSQETTERPAAHEQAGVERRAGSQPRASAKPVASPAAGVDASEGPSA